MFWREKSFVDYRKFDDSPGRLVTLTCVRRQATMKALFVWVVAAAVLQVTIAMGNSTTNPLAKTGACFTDPTTASCAETASYYTDVDRNGVRDREHVCECADGIGGSASAAHPPVLLLACELLTSAVPRRSWTTCA